MQNMAKRSEYINSYYSGCCLYIAGDGMLLCGFIATILLYQEISLQFINLYFHCFHPVYTPCPKKIVPFFLFIFFS